jgi:xylose isomerase
MILKDKAEKFNRDPEIQGLLSEVKADDGSMDAFKGSYSSEKASALKSFSFDRAALGKRGFPYERLDMLVTDLLLGVR